MLCGSSENCCTIMPFYFVNIDGNFQNKNKQGLVSKAVTRLNLICIYTRPSESKESLMYAADDNCNESKKRQQMCHDHNSSFLYAR